MSGFDYESAARARKNDPDLTKVDTGEVLSPYAYRRDGDNPGYVDFDTDEGISVLTVKGVAPSDEAGNTFILDLAVFTGATIVIMHNGVKVGEVTDVE